jgi:CubicO group peptidase (beta-lactamase class C family)
MSPLNCLWHKLFFLLILTIGIVSRPGYGQSVLKNLDDFISAYYKSGDFNGCVLVAEKGKAIFEKAYGYTDYTTSDTLTTDYQFRLASVSKQFTAMAIMILMERQVLEYDDEVNLYLSDFPYKNVTIRNLLTHTSGLPDYGDLLDKYWDVDDPSHSVVSNRDLYTLLTQYAPPQKFNPGEDHQYCNTGYLVLALLVEEITGQSFQSFLSENIFTPLGMSNSYLNPANGQLDDHHRAKGFTRNLDGTGYLAKDWHYQNGMYGDGGVISTVHDLLLWDRALRSEKLVHQSTLQEAFTQVMLKDGTTREYGFGWSVIKQDSGIIVAHGGGWLGYTTGILRDLSSDQTIIQLCNMPSKRIIFSLWDILNGREISLPKFVNVTFVVTPKILAENDSIFVTGNHGNLGNWNPAKIMLEKISANHWQRTIPIEKNFELEYKITRGSWDKEALYEKGLIPENTILRVQQDTLIDIQVPFWKDLSEK